MNPYNSIWNKPRPQIIRDKQLYFRWAPIKRYLTSSVVLKEHGGIISVDGNIYIAKNSSKFRLKSHLDWAWYTPKTIAQAIDNNTIEQYYEIMLNDVRSDPNIWSDHDFEMTLKAFYAARVGRSSLLD